MSSLFAVMAVLPDHDHPLGQERTVAAMIPLPLPAEHLGGDEHQGGGHLGVRALSTLEMDPAKARRLWEQAAAISVSTEPRAEVA